MIRGIAFGIAAVLFMLLVASFSNGAKGVHTEEPEVSPDVLVTFGFPEEDVVLNLAHAYETGGQQALDEAGSGYLMTLECFVIEGGYLAYIDRVVKKTNYKYQGEDTYVVEAHFWGAPLDKVFYFLFYGELPVRARRSAA